MAEQKPEVTAPSASIYGDRVKIRFSGGLSGRIVELRGPLGPGGSRSTASAFAVSRSPSTLS